MFNVCTRRYGMTVILKSFDTKRKAEKFSKNNYTFLKAEDFKDLTEDQIITPDQMFISTEDLPFCEAIDKNYILSSNQDELPY